jgi:hypothetical protein
MSETTTTPVQGMALVAQTSSIAPALGSMGIGGATVVVLTWLLSLTHIVLPPDVSVALVTLVSAVAHYLQDRFVGNPTPTKIS